MVAENYICAACGTEFAASLHPPSVCPICIDERQSTPPSRAGWTTLTALPAHFQNRIVELEEGVFSIATKPVFAIGQQAFLIRTTGGNVLWDCVNLLDSGTVSRIEALGGIGAIALSHPHFYGSAVDWSAAFGNVPIYVHEADSAWILRPAASHVLWTGESRQILGNARLIHCGGHFAGSAVLHWPDGAGRRGVIFAGDTVCICPDNRWVSFMYSYPNYIPLDEAAIRQICERLSRVTFDRIYSAFEGCIETGAALAVRKSGERYISFLNGWRRDH